MSIEIKRRYIVICMLLSILVIGCTNNTPKNKESSKDSLNVINKDSSHLKPSVYITHKQECGFDGSKSDSTFLLDSSRITISIALECEGNYVVTDTSYSNDTCNVYAYRNQVVHITIKSLKETQVVIRKEFITKSLKDNVNFTNYLLGTTTIDSIAEGEKSIRFVTFLGYPQSDFGWYAIYYVTYEGQIKNIKLVDNSEDE